MSVFITTMLLGRLEDSDLRILSSSWVAGWDFELPGLVEGVPAHDREAIQTVRYFPTQTILWFPVVE